MFTKYLILHNARWVIWFGDLNCLIAQSYSETQKLMGENALDSLSSKDQVVDGNLLHR